MSAAPIGALVGLALALACGRRSPEPPPTVVPPARHDASTAPVAHGSTLLSLPVSAYHVSIVTDEDDVAYLLTSGAAYRLAPGRAPAEMPMDLGLGAGATRSSFVHWSSGAVFASPKNGTARRRLVAIAGQPQLFIASGEEIAWLRRSDDGRASLQTVSGKKPFTVYASPGTIDAATMLGDSLFFVERPAGADWRIGRVRTTGGAPVFTALRKGRAPAMLAARRDVYYYDGNRFEVRRLSVDLQREQTLASGFICSPIAVAEHVYCAQVDGIFELRADARPRRLVPGSTEKLITDLAASPNHLYWVVDSGADRLEVRTLALPR